MGNNQSGVSNTVERFSIDDSLQVVWRKGKSRKGREGADAWSAEYSIGRRSCELGLSLSFSTTNPTQNQEELTISIKDRVNGYSNDDVEFQLDVTIIEGLLSGNTTLDGPSSIQQLPLCKTVSSQNAVFKSSSFFYGRDNDRKGLIVILRAKTNDDDKKLPNMITVKHYFIATNCSQGVYVVAKIRSNSDGGGLSFQLEKPVAQSKRALQSLFDDVKEKGWKPNPNGSEFATIQLFNQNKGKVPVICSENKSINHNHANGDLFSYSISGYQNVSSLVSTSGYNNGDYNGAVILNNCQVMLLNSYARWEKLLNISKSTENHGFDQSEHDMLSNLLILNRRS
ncbi:hypothetical protein VNO77_23707 [Canavalia gladiata]|uniref:Uncharacterized protein n=1 Tax=Canavalia gladiata TaxID=3824 RepID=A0AAN9QBY6_CANGL